MASLPHGNDATRDIVLSDVLPENYEPQWFVTDAVDRIQQLQSQRATGIVVIYQDIPSDQLEYYAPRDTAVIRANTNLALIVKYVQKETGYPPSTIQRALADSRDPTSGYRTLKNYDLVVIM